MLKAKVRGATQVDRGGVTVGAIKTVRIIQTEGVYFDAM